MDCTIYKPKGYAFFLGALKKQIEAHSSERLNKSRHNRNVYVNRQKTFHSFFTCVCVRVYLYI